MNLSVGDEQSFKATAVDQSGNEMNGVSVFWSLSDTSVATLVSAGRVRGVKEGETHLTASSGNIVSEPVAIRVIPRSETPPEITSITLSAASAEIDIGEKYPFVALAKDSKGQTVSRAVFSWHSSNSAVATIDPDGMATGTGAGETTITASVGTVEASASLTVRRPANALPTADFTADRTSGTAPLTVRFDGSKSSDPDGPIASYSWTFGDGETGSGAVIDHTYTQPGSYPVVLQVRDNQGAVGTSKTITIHAETVGTGWKKQGVPADLFGVSFVSPLEGWTAGLEQAIFHTTDGGQTWAKQANFIWQGSPPPADAPVDFYDLFFVDRQVGWAVGWPEAIFKTTDGGATWIEQHLNRAHLNPPSCPTCKKAGVYLRQVKFLDSRHGWVVGRNGYIFKTDDGGANWAPISQQHRRAFPVPCFKNGVERSGFDYNPHLFTVHIVGLNEVWVGGGSEGDEPCEKGWLRVVMHTRDGGRTWDYFWESEANNTGTPDPRAQLDGNGRIFDLKMIGNIGWAVGGASNATALQYDATRPGKQWVLSRVPSEPNAAYYGLAFFSPLKIWMVGWHGLIMHSGDGGATWTKQAATTDGQLRRLFFLDENTGWIASQHQVIRTVSGGK